MLCILLLLLLALLCAGMVAANVVRGDHPIAHWCVLCMASQISSGAEAAMHQVVPSDIALGLLGMAASSSVGCIAMQGGPRLGGGGCRT